MTRLRLVPALPVEPPIHWADDQVYAPGVSDRPAQIPARSDATQPSGHVSGHVLGHALLAALGELADRIGVQIRVEPFDLVMTGKGGLCRLRGKPVILVDAKLGIVERIGIIGQALGKVVPKGTYVSRELAPYLRTGHAAVRPAARLRLRPLARTR